MMYHRNILLEHEKEVLKNIPNPFGSFEKAKYVLCKCRNGSVIYSFVTTAHNTEDCVDILKTLFNERLWNGRVNNYMICKYRNGRKEILYTHVVNDRP